jgi:hypothetical protein
MEQRYAERGAPTDLERNFPALGIFVRFGQEVCDLSGFTVDDGTGINAPTHKDAIPRNGVDAINRYAWTSSIGIGGRHPSVRPRYGVLSDRATQGNLPMVGNEAQTIAKHLKDRRVLRIAQARRGLHQRIKYRLQVKGRPADDLQNFCRGRLLFQCILQLALAGLLGLEEARVLDGDAQVRRAAWRDFDLSARSSALLREPSRIVGDLRGSSCPVPPRHDGAVRVLIAEVPWKRRRRYTYCDPLTCSGLGLKKTVRRSQHACGMCSFSPSR